MRDTSDMVSGSEGLAIAVRAGLSQPRKVIQARFFYDSHGSELFEAITRLPEYYPTRAEIAVLSRHGEAIARTVGRGRVVVEFGSGSSTKTPLLLRHVAPVAYVPVDISAEFLAVSAAALAASEPGLRVVPIAADFTQPLTLPPDLAPLPKLGFFPGSTIGNLVPADAIDLLRALRTSLGETARLVLGLDLCRDRSALLAAYDDPAGVTAAFNLNVLARINRELGGDIPLDRFAHRAVWNERLGRVEMHLEATDDIVFGAAGRRFRMRAGETIHTENSYKHLPSDVALMARASGWEPIATWSDPATAFSVQAWQAEPSSISP
jgi:L-histidine N-alpha-methyltransferase